MSDRDKLRQKRQAENERIRKAAGVEWNEQHGCYVKQMNGQLYRRVPDNADGIWEELPE